MIASNLKVKGRYPLFHVTGILVEICQGRLSRGMIERDQKVESHANAVLIVRPFIPIVLNMIQNYSNNRPLKIDVAAISFMSFLLGGFGLPYHEKGAQATPSTFWLVSCGV